MTSPIRPTDDEARQLARDLIQKARFGALAVLDPTSGAPLVSRIAVVPGLDGLPLSLVSDLAAHTVALKANPVCSLMVGEPGTKGDPLTHPRLSLQGTAQFIRHGAPDHGALAAHYLRLQPKAKLYIGFGDFALMRLAVTGAFLNGGFGKAFDLTPGDLT
ncbi:HugZ family pyridoxamine 5'-phosphate oxidase [Tropicibacter oceani]|uniref:Pyridoxamine 5'-phosphate oxidase family protein n=1 Tax=Tropicibacter oceani TaxID=3058420 RepID=A0ABY8QJB1_9RHOB|nr:pyridoxamine 5'-phosphate oxidase family protein [Tropicibacter oceani]WGW04086.1 pyridoxamine 5'-phosphate oxidase family protein [Tropicibacter oceani]